MCPSPNTLARDAYDALAPAYDALTADYDHDGLLGDLVALAREHGLAGRRALDVGCGTGKSFLPLLARGFQVAACDASPQMVRRARRAAAGRAVVRVADMRRLPAFGAFDLVTCVDDAINYLLDEDELAAAFAGMAANLAPGGLLAFDVNTLATYRQSFVSDWALDTERDFIVWRGGDYAALPAGGQAEATIDVFRRRGDGWERVTSRHRQRHHPMPAIRRHLEGAGLRVVGCHGYRPGEPISEGLDEAHHSKAIFIATHVPESEEGKESP